MVDLTALKSSSMADFSKISGEFDKIANPQSSQKQGPDERFWKLDPDKPYELRQPTTWQEIAACAVEVLEKRSDVRAPQDHLLAFTDNGVPIYSTGGGRRGRRAGGGGGNGSNAGPAALPPPPPSSKSIILMTLRPGLVKYVKSKVISRCIARLLSLVKQVSLQPCWPKPLRIRRRDVRYVR